MDPESSGKHRRIATITIPSAAPCSNDNANVKVDASGRWATGPVATGGRVAREWNTNSERHWMDLSRLYVRAVSSQNRR